MGEQTRRRDVSRLEGFSDAVFGFAITMLVVVGVLSAVIAALVPEQAGIAGFAYFLVAVPAVVAGTLVGRRRRLEARRAR